MGACAIATRTTSLALGITLLVSLILRGSAAAAPATTAGAAAAPVSEIVVLLRSQAGDSGASPRALADADIERLSRASGLTLSRGEIARTGEQVLRLARPMMPADLRIALDAIRNLDDVLYADPVPERTAVAGAAAATKPTGAGNTVTQIVVKLADPDVRADSDANLPLDAVLLDRVSRIAGVDLTSNRAMSGGAYVLDLPRAMTGAEAAGVASRLEADPLVIYADPVTYDFAQRSPNDEYYPLQWHYFESIGGVNLPSAWNLTTGAAGIPVAVIDTGILFGHPDLAGRTLPGYDMLSDARTAGDGNGRDADPSDPGDWAPADWCSSGSPARNSSWHGTHVAGTIGALSNNAAGVAGVNWMSPILPVRVLGDCGGTTADIADAIRWAAGLPVPGVPANPNPARVLNLSLSGSGACPSTYQDAINAALAQNAVVVVAAGNDGENAGNYRPANCAGVITVHAANRAGGDAYYSNVGTTVEISAPGGDTRVSYPGPYGTLVYDGVLSLGNDGTQGPGGYGYFYKQGTSMAAPHVAGVASLMLSVNSALTPGQVLSRLQDTARSFPAGGGCTTSLCGAGIVDAGAAVAASVNAAGPCVPSNTTLCLQNGRFRVQVAWADLSGTPGAARVSVAFPNSGLFYFYGADNAEILVKVLNGCADPSFPNYWVFGAAATTFPFTITVTDGVTGFVRQYSNPSGHPADTITDVNAFATCP